MRHHILDVRGLTNLDDGRIDLPNAQGENDTQKIEMSLEERPAEELIEYAGRGPREREIVESIFSRRWMKRE